MKRNISLAVAGQRFSLGAAIAIAVSLAATAGAAPTTGLPTVSIAMEASQSALAERSSRVPST